MQQKKTKQCFILSVLLICFISATASTLSEKIQNQLKAKFPNANIGIFLQDADSGKVLYQQNAKQVFTVASNTKLFTAAAALYELGPHYRYTTAILQNKGNVYVKFSGDPSLKVTELQTLIKALKKKGIQKISGNIIIDESRFTGPEYPDGLSYEDLGWYYAAPVTAISLDNNMVRYHLSSKQSIGKRLKIRAMDKPVWQRIINRVTVVSKLQAKQHCDLHLVNLPQNTVELRGCWSRHKTPNIIRLAITDPYSLAVDVIKQQLKQSHVTLHGKFIRGKTPKYAKVIARHHSKPMVNLVTHMMQHSDNLYADSLFKTLASEMTGVGDFKQGTYAVKQILEKHAKLHTKLLKFADGSGTRYDLFSPEQISQLLMAIYHEPKLKSQYLATLATPGIGTLKDRMHAPLFQQANIHAKSGSMHDASALSGYITTKSKQHLVFVITINQVVKHIKNAKKLEDNLLEIFYEEVSR